jgi:hypothetical protein
MLSSACALGALMKLESSGKKIIHPAAWKTEQVHAHSKDLPLEALAMMKALRAIDWRITFYVSTLYQDTRPLDPVLWADRFGERIAILVWDEHGDIVMV